MVRKRNWTALVICVAVAVLCLAALLIGLRNNIGGWFFSGRVDSDKAYSYTVATGDINSLEIDWVNGKVEVQISESADEISIVEYGNRELEEKDQLYLKESGGVLTVKWQENSNLVSIFNWLEKDLVVEIPKALAENLESFTCMTVSGDIQAGDLNAVDCEMSTTSGEISAAHIQSNSLEFTSVSGSINISQTDSDGLKIFTTSGSIRGTELTAQDAEVNTVSGSVDLKGAFTGALAADSTSGSVDIVSSACPDKVDFGSISGSLRLTLPENKGFTAKYSSVSGDFKSDFPTTGDSGNSGQAVYEDGSASFSFETVSGDMNILSE